MTAKSASTVKTYAASTPQLGVRYDADTWLYFHKKCDFSRNSP